MITVAFLRRCLEAAISRPSISLLKPELHPWLLNARLALSEPIEELPSWQPIETAPTDGTPYLVFLEKETLHSRIQVGYSKSKFKVIAGQFDFDMPKATHWMPLPKGPTT